MLLSIIKVKFAFCCPITPFFCTWKSKTRVDIPAFASDVKYRSVNSESLKILKSKADYPLFDNEESVKSKTTVLLRYALISGLTGLNVPKDAEVIPTI